MSDSPPPVQDDPELGRGFTLAVVLSPIGFFSVYLIAVMAPGARSWIGALLLAVLAAGSYIGLAMVGTRWFESHRRR